MALSSEEPRDANADATASDVERGDADAKNKPEEAQEEFPSIRKVALIMVAMYLSMFLVALVSPLTLSHDPYSCNQDRTILGTAIPKITDDFHSISQVGWYASAYLLTTSAFQLIYGRIYTFYSPKWVLLVAIGIFELGSTVCGAAPNSDAFIIGRAIGFYINLPIGALVVLILLFILHTPPSQNKDTVRQKIMKLDPYGSIVFLPGIVCFLLALQWGGTTYSWSNVRIIILFILAFILLSIFTYLQFHLGDNATVPIRIISQRSVASGVYFSLLSPGSMMIIVYFLPQWFQAILGVSAVKSGIDTLPLVLALVLASITSGVITGKTGYYVPQLLACSVIMSIGVGLLTTLKIDTSTGKWIGYQIVFGFGLGLGMQQASMAAQASLDKKDVMTGVSLMFFMQGIGSSIFISIGQAVFNHSLLRHLTAVADLNPELILNTGATDLRNLVPGEMLDFVLKAYNAALSDTFKVAVGCAAATIVAGATMEWKNVKGLKQGGPSGQKVKEEKTAASDAPKPEVTEGKTDTPAES
ncbi:hypothetical protein B7494_g2571 [Chlorociboria aeruginascens]|nr:hypothetical protein B7494_g2571 [Chlorociboria aeruginascens]